MRIVSSESWRVLFAAVVWIGIGIFLLALAAVAGTIAGLHVKGWHSHAVAGVYGGIAALAVGCAVSRKRICDER